ncbi:GTP pyrophosphokinase [Morganella morganii]|uniref:GTP pyrophosphokinase n=1 Tax=Morganella morganii TaxID=582 RepID=UPI003EB7FD2B
MSKKNGTSKLSDAGVINEEVKDVVEKEYEFYRSKGDYILIQIKEQINKILEENEITLGVPLESRVKSKSSILEKIRRKKLKFEHITELKDFLGLRIILLFKRDVDKVVKCIEDNFMPINFDEKKDEIDVEKFGYQSIHRVVKTSEGWHSIPTLSDSKLFNIEIQIRTLSQHIWAAASHKLQYKIEDQIPKPLQRTINRMSAILELVDLEFDRVLYDRDAYLSDIENKTEDIIGIDSALNIEILKYISKKYLPQERLASDDSYSDLLLELSKNEITTAGGLISIIESNWEKTREMDKSVADSMISSAIENNREIKDIWHGGRYFNDVELIKLCALEDFSKKGKEYNMDI